MTAPPVCARRTELNLLGGVCLEVPPGPEEAGAHPLRILVHLDQFGEVGVRRFVAGMAAGWPEGQDGVTSILNRQLGSVGCRGDSSAKANMHPVCSRPRRSSTETLTARRVQACGAARAASSTRGCSCWNDRQSSNSKRSGRSKAVGNGGAPGLAESVAAFGLTPLNLRLGCNMAPA